VEKEVYWKPIAGCNRLQHSPSRSAITGQEQQSLQLPSTLGRMSTTSLIDEIACREHLQFARAMGGRVAVVSSTRQKEAQA
jgi:hypothetical protein